MELKNSSVDTNEGNDKMLSRDLLRGFYLFHARRHRDRP